MTPDQLNGNTTLNELIQAMNEFGAAVLKFRLDSPTDAFAVAVVRGKAEADAVFKAIDSLESDDDAPVIPEQEKYGY